jgi:hypothetical protein
MDRATSAIRRQLLIRIDLRDQQSFCLLSQALDTISTSFTNFCRNEDDITIPRKLHRQRNSEGQMLALLEVSEVEGRKKDIPISKGGD